MKLYISRAKVWPDVRSFPGERSALLLVNLCLISMLFLGFGNALGAPVSPTQAKQAADNYFAARFPKTQAARCVAAAQSEATAGSLVPLINDQQVTIGYVRQYAPSGYVVMRADTLCPPTKIFSEDGVFSELPRRFAKVIQHELEEELVAVTSQAQGSATGNGQKLASPEKDYGAEWKTLLAGGASMRTYAMSAESAGVALISDFWNQDLAYNYYAPRAAGGPGGRAYAGCVACAMSMVLHYHKQPAAISHDHKYVDTAGACSGAHFISDAGMASYQWANMPTSITSGSPLAQRQAVGQLMYHCGVAVEMDYEADGSGANLELLPAALANYFNYTSTQLLYRGDYQSADWFKMVTADIDAGKPIIWGMFDRAWENGHCVVVDGYSGTNQVHFNLGWSGSYNSWYNLDLAIPPAGWVWHMAVFQITPKYVAPPATVLTVKASGANGAVSITVSPSDLDDANSGATPFSRRFADGTQVYLTAPEKVGTATFAYWQTIDGNVATATIGVSINGSATCTAVYSSIPVPQNDAFENATSMNMTAFSGMVTGSNIGASVQPLEPSHAGTGPFNSVWWTFVLGKNAALSLNTHGSAFDTVLALYTGSSVSALTLVAANDEDGSSGNCSGLVDIPLKEGQRYYVAVAGASATATGAITLNWSLPRGTIIGWETNVSFSNGASYRYNSPVWVGWDACVVNLPDFPGGTGTNVYARLEDIDTGEPVTWATVEGSPPFSGKVSVNMTANPTFTERKCQFVFGYFYGSYQDYLVSLNPPPGVLPKRAVPVNGPVLVQLARPKRPDFQVLSVTTAPEKPAAGAFVDVLVSIRNSGTAAGKAGACSIILDGAQSPSMALDTGNMAIGEKKTMLLRFTAPSAGQHVLRAKIAPANGVQEESTSNNALDVPFSVSSVSITSRPATKTVEVGKPAEFSITAIGSGVLAYQWNFNGKPSPGATGASLVISGAQTENAGGYTCTVSNGTDSVTCSVATLSVSSEVSRLANLSIRTGAGSGDQTLIAGIVVTGTGTKPLLVRAIGPSLAPFGVNGTIADPVLELHGNNGGGDKVVDMNDDWGGNTELTSVFARVGAFTLSNSASRDAALYESALPVGLYTTQVSGKFGATGIALMEVYDATSGSFTATTPRLVNLSARAQVGTGDSILIAGFSIVGVAPKTILVRGVGPGLAPFGVNGSLLDPLLTVHGTADNQDVVIASCDNWGGTDELIKTFAQVGAFPLNDPNSKDSALLITLSPGSYTAQVSGVNNATGVALIEVYEVP
jgi:hypothetical protein